MPLFNDTTVKIDGAHVVWDGITQPDKNDDGTLRYNIKVVIPPNNPDIQLAQQLATNEMNSGDFRGVWPAGGIWPMKLAEASEFQGMYPGWTVINCTTYNTPQVFDESGRQMDPMEYGRLIYGNQQVNVLVHFKSYYNKSKGIAARLDGFQIVASAQAPMVNFGGVNAAAAFGGGAPGGGGMGAPAGAPLAAHQHQQPGPASAPGGMAPAPGAPAAGPTPGYGQPPAAAGAPPAAGGYPAPGAPQPGAPGAPPQQAAPGQYMPPGYPGQQ